MKSNQCKKIIKSVQQGKGMIIDHILNNNPIKTCHKCHKLIEAKQEVYSNSENTWWHLVCLKKTTKKKITTEDIKLEVEKGKSLLLKLIFNKNQ